MKNNEHLFFLIYTLSLKGSIPAFVMATTGSTVLGSCDDLNAVADVCEKHGVWMHVDVRLPA